MEQGFLEFKGITKVFPGVVVAEVGMYISASVNGLIAFRLLQGIAVASWVCATVLFASYLPSNEAVSATVQLQIANSAGTLSGYFIGGFVTFRFGYRSVFLIAAIGALLALGTSLLIREDYKACIGISTRGAIGEMRVPALLAVVIPVACGFLAGPEFVGGLIIGSTLCSIMIAIFSGNAGGAWDNGKKYIEQGGIEGAVKGDASHAAAVVGDTVGDPLKDTVGPCLDIFIKIMSTVSLVTVAVFDKYNLFDWIFKIR